MSKRSLFFALTLLLAYPAFMSAGDKDINKNKDENNPLGPPKISKNVASGNVSPVDENIKDLTEATKDLFDDAATEFVEFTNSKGKKWKIARVVTAPYRGLRGAGSKIKKGLGKLFSRKKRDGTDVEDTNISVVIQNTVEGCKDVLETPADIVLNTSFTDVAKFAGDVKISDFWEYRLVLAGFTVATSTDIALVYFLYKAYNSEPVQKRLRAVRNMVRGATVQEQKKTA